MTLPLALRGSGSLVSAIVSGLLLMRQPLGAPGAQDLGANVRWGDHHHLRPLAQHRTGFCDDPALDHVRESFAQYRYDPRRNRFPARPG